jgi:nicotinate-nucleotide pyrophosphorylase (carboxylating)
VELTLDRVGVAAVVETALAEDVGAGDVTTEGTIAPETRCRAQLLLKEPGVVAGLDVARLVFQSVDPDVIFDALAGDGDRLDPVPVVLAQIEGPARAVLTGERVALNLLGRLSGIATLTRRYVDAVGGTGARILDTRKTTPGLRALEKYAVRCGGGTNHRFGLFDAILVKENHIRLGGGITAAVQSLRRASSLPVQVETETLDEVREALAAGVDGILLDNMAPELMAEAVALARGSAYTEASGGVTLETVRRIAETGVDFVSSGALTHSARSLDVSLEVLS